MSGENTAHSSQGNGDRPGLSPRSKPRLLCTHLVRLKGVFMRRMTAGRGAAPAGSCKRKHGHSGGSGAPPGPTKRSRREPADALKAAFELTLSRKRGPGPETPRPARREALACRKARTIYGPRLSARRPPLYAKRGKEQSPDAEHASRQRSGLPTLGRHARTCSGHPIGQCGGFRQSHDWMAGTGPGHDEEKWRLQPGDDN